MAGAAPLAPTLAGAASAPSPDASLGVVIFGHGSRDPLWRLPMETVAARVRARLPSAPVRCAYLELQAPSLPEAAAELAGLGLQQVRVLPMFLGSGRHVRQDLPQLMAALAADHPAVRWTLLAPVGEDARVLELLATLAVDDLTVPAPAP